MSITNNMRQLRKQRGLSLTELARKSGVSRGYLYLIESGNSVPSIEKTQLIADVLGVTIDILINGDNPYSSDEQRLLAAWKTDNYSVILHMVAKEIMRNKIRTN